MGDCHFLEGNLRAKERVAHAKNLLDEIGLDGRRLEMFHIGASDAPNWAKAVREMTQRAQELGPNPIRKSYRGKGTPPLSEAAPMTVNL
jgi:coenzyme F420-reducing hydrogenase delta subunit